MTLFETIDEAIKGAMKARAALRLEVLRSIKKELLEARSAKNSGGVISENDEVKIVKKMLKQRKDASTIYAAQGRADLKSRSCS